MRSTELDRRLAALPENQITRISIGRWRGIYQAGSDQADYAELGGFHVSGPCTATDIVRRYGPGSYRITACAHDLLWEVLVEDLR